MYRQSLKGPPGSKAAWDVAFQPSPKVPISPCADDPVSFVVLHTGIGSLLMDGLGDTIRVSLTEDPEFELNPCR